MALTYTQLSQAIQDYTENTETTFVSNIPVFVKQAEDRIWFLVDLPDFFKHSTSSTASSIRYMSAPTDMVSIRSISVVSGNVYYFLLPKQTDFILEAYPSTTAEGRPRFWSMWDSDTIMLGPTPDAIYDVELHYSYKPESIVTASTSWLGNNAEHCLLYGSLVEAYTFMKGEDDVIKKYEAMFQEAIARLKNLAEARSRGDEYRSGEPRRSPS